jgi:hypothetical protein
MSNTSVAPASTSLLRSKQVHPLPIGSGGSNPTKTQMNETNIQLAMLTAQANADTKYDPPVPKPVTKAVTKESFTNQSVGELIAVVGGLLIVYSIIAK